MKTRFFLMTFALMAILMAFVAFCSLSLTGAGGTWKVMAGVVGFTVLWAFAAPLIEDLILNWSYKSTTYTWDEFSRQYPALAPFIEKLCREKKIPIPRMRIIHDENPNAFCYGLGPWNARLVATEGIFKFLTEDEVNSVYAHELGHIVNLDFIVMTVATVLLSILYEIYVLGKPRRSDSKNPFAAVAIFALIFYEIGTFVLRALSRTRELMADRFSAVATGNPNLLSFALVKVAYGITKAAAQGADQRILEKTRVLGLVDTKKAGTVGTTYAHMVKASGKHSLEKLFLFDLFSPWAWLSEWSSTHPLTGHRVQYLNGYCQDMGVAPGIDLSPAKLQSFGVDRARLIEQFALDLVIYVSPFILAIAGFGVSYGLHRDWGTLIAAAVIGGALGFLLVTWARCPSSHEPRDTDLFELMTDPYAGPLRGQYVRLNGKLIGRGDAGNVFGSDLVLQDEEGFIAMTYHSAVPIVGDFWFGWRKVKTLIGGTAQATGWFHRDAVADLTLAQLKTDKEIIPSYPRLWTVMSVLLVMAFGVGIVLLFTAIHK